MRNVYLKALIKLKNEKKKIIFSVISENILPTHFLPAHVEINSF